MSEETHWEQAAKTRMGKYLTRIETAFIQQSIDFSVVKVVADVGAEAGRFSLTAANPDLTVVGLDIDSYSLHRLKKKSRDITVVQADARKVPAKSEAFDVVLMIEVLDYISELQGVLAECWRILKPGCSLVVSFGNRSSLKAKLRKLQGKTYMHSYDNVLYCLQDLGFEITRKMGYSWLPLGRMSQSRLVAFLAGVERIFGLRSIPSLSPWVILCAVKTK